MKKLMVLMVIGIAAFAISASLPVENAGTTIVGTWKTIDDETGKARSHVKVFKAKNGMYYGKIEKLLNRTPDEGVDPYCEVCPKDDYRYKKRVIGMNIVTKMKASKDVKSASGGQILDPLGRSQTWIRIK